MPDVSRRKYALVQFEYYKMKVCIIEICNICFAISTLIIYGEDPEERALVTLKSLNKSNGHWNKRCLSEIEKRNGIIKIIMLKHFENRKSDKWMRLILSSIRN